MNRKAILGAIIGVVVILLLCFIMCDGDSQNQNAGVPSVMRNRKDVTVEQLEKDYASGVTLIYNISYYTITFKGMGTFYFSRLDENGDIEGFTYDEDEIQPVISTGTGFFISKEGLIATNNHVVAETIDESHVRAQIISELSNAKDEFKNQINRLTEQIATLNISYHEDQSYQTKKKIDKLRTELDELQDITNKFDRFSSAEYSVGIESESYVAYHDTYVKSINDLKGCQLIANDTEHDLAIIQLSDKKTPEERHIFEIDKSGTVPSGEDLFIIGY